jgi:hypothetical protein
MLGRLVLLLLQLGIGWYAMPHIGRYLPKLGQLDIFVLAVIFAILVCIVGFVGALVLKDVAPPSSATVTTTLIVALIFAALTLVPQIMAFVDQFARGVPRQVYPLIGAVLGYAARR